MFLLFVAAPDVLVDRNGETLDQVGAVAPDEVRVVLGIMLARLGDKIAQAFEEFEAHRVALPYLLLLRCLAQKLYPLDRKYLLRLVAVQRVPEI